MQQTLCVVVPGGRSACLCLCLETKKEGQVCIGGAGFIRGTVLDVLEGWKLGGSIVPPCPCHHTRPRLGGPVG